MNERMTEMSDKIQMKTPLVEMDGDEMTRIMWQMIKDIPVSYTHLDVYKRQGPTWALAPTFLFTIVQIAIVNLFCNGSFSL